MKDLTPAQKATLRAIKKRPQGEHLKDIQDPFIFGPPRVGRPVTGAQSATLEAVRNFVQHMGWPPSVQEVAAMIGAKSTRTAWEHLSALMRKGYIQMGGKARQLRIVEIPAKRRKVT